MTAQFPDKLINECESVDLTDLALHAVLVGDVRNTKNITAYPFSQKANKDKLNIFTACWNGYTSIYKITATKELVLVGFEYPAMLPQVIEPDEVEELVTGDFWLSLRPDFFADSIYVPFRNGKLIADKNEWVNI